MFQNVISVSNVFSQNSTFGAPKLEVNCPKGVIEIFLGKLKTKTTKILSLLQIAKKFRRKPNKDKENIIACLRFPTFQTHLLKLDSSYKTVVKIDEWLGTEIW